MIAAEDPDKEATRPRTPYTLRQRASELRDQAQEAFHSARASGQLPDKELILRCTRLSKELEKQALELEDHGATQLNPGDEENATQEQIDRWTDQSQMSRVEDGLYISGFDALEDSSVLVQNNISHILSVCRFHLPSQKQQELYTCSSVPVLDTSDQNILQYLRQCVEFIDSCLSARGNMLIHCHAGQSRSAAIMTAYLMQRDKVGVRTALDKVKYVRRVQPNENFMNQLRLYRDCDYNVTDENALYRRWKFENMYQALPLAVESLSTSTTANGLTTYQENDTSSKYTQIRCKKCRYVLASENHIIQHEPKTSPAIQPESQQSSLIPASCAHFFLEPIRWMKTELDRGELDGRFTCPNSKCRAKIGSYAWQGMTCSCRRWVLPALCIQRAKVDELKSKTPAKVEPARKPTVKTLDR